MANECGKGDSMFTPVHEPSCDDLFGRYNDLASFLKSRLDTTNRSYRFNRNTSYRAESTFSQSVFKFDEDFDENGKKISKSMFVGSERNNKNGVQTSNSSKFTGCSKLNQTGLNGQFLGKLDKTSIQVKFQRATPNKTFVNAEESSMKKKKRYFPTLWPDDSENTLQSFADETFDERADMLATSFHKNRSFFEKLIDDDDATDAMNNTLEQAGENEKINEGRLQKDSGAVPRKSKIPMLSATIRSKLYEKYRMDAYEIGRGRKSKNKYI
ncbi:hypothetical protein HELRODRAFT_175507 [Helobdella robusta]|uniref:Uncharacterized protein n=1 Tax=Helobdella robusta TaxID=6412 RepID=T1F9C3_HELRO|nr:hypothetical protein HELRODRAFT_175507 [Helobdella robusta]ESO00547.1 hypothetical protein HELRODRAFT_175507 [Helobdella robusta]